MVWDRVKAFAVADEGATAIEYGLLAALIAVGCIASFTLLGGSLTNLFGTSSEGAGGVMESAASSI